MKNKHNVPTFLQIEKTKLVFSALDVKNRSAQLIGFHKKVFTEILKRFFTNKIAVFFSLVFLFILLTSFVAYATSPFSATEPINDAQIRFIRYLPAKKSTVKVVKYLDQQDLWNVFIKPNLTKYPDMGFIQSSNDVISIHYKPWRVLQVIMEKANQEAKFLQTTKSILGTDQYGIDNWTRIWAATAYSILLAFLVVLTNMTLGIFLGSYIGYHVGKMLDTLFMRFLAIFNAIPSIIWYIIIVRLFGNTNFLSIYAALVITGWSGWVYSGRSLILFVKDAEYVIASKSIGASKIRQIFVHALPAIAGKLANGALASTVGVFFSISALAFLGLVPTGKDSINLGNVLTEGANEKTESLTKLIFTGSILVSYSLAINFVALGLHDALDPKIRIVRK